MSLAAETREAVRARPFLRDALRAGVVNHSAAATWLAERDGLDGDPDAIAAALRRFREDLPGYETEERDASVSMRSGVAVVESGDTELGETGGSEAEPDAHLLHVGEAAGVAGEALVCVVGRRDGATAVRVVEAALAAAPAA
ncbi:hypothetical protein BRD22_09550 [Halobacteriales archaeon SW_8_68_21]|nr:MAG: hypothetical protein BRD22_09550 [Halobacteriales archaeon SW_8_68_21]